MTPIPPVSVRDFASLIARLESFGAGNADSLPGLAVGLAALREAQEGLRQILKGGEGGSPVVRWRDKGISELESLPFMTGWMQRLRTSGGQQREDSLMELSRIFTHIAGRNSEDYARELERKKSERFKQTLRGGKRTAQSIRHKSPEVEAWRYQSHYSRAHKILTDIEIPVHLRLMAAEVLGLLYVNKGIFEKYDRAFSGPVIQYYTGPGGFGKVVEVFKAVISAYQEIRPWERFQLEELDRPSSYPGDPGSVPVEITGHPFAAVLLSEVERGHGVIDPSRALALGGSSEADLRRALGFAEFVFFVLREMDTRDAGRLASQAALLARHPEAFDTKTWRQWGHEVALPQGVSDDIKRDLHERVRAETGSLETSLEQLTASLEALVVLSEESDPVPLLIEALEGDQRGFCNLQEAPVRVWAPCFRLDEVAYRLGYLAGVREVRPIEDLLEGNPDRAREVTVEALLHLHRRQQITRVIRRTRAEAIKRLDAGERPPAVMLREALWASATQPDRSRMERFLSEARQKWNRVEDDRMVRFLQAVLDYHSDAAVRIAILSRLGQFSNSRKGGGDAHFRFVRDFNPDGNNALAELEEFFHRMGVPTVPPSLASMAEVRADRARDVRARETLLAVLRQEGPLDLVESVRGEILKYEKGARPPYPFREPDDLESPTPPIDPQDRLSLLRWKVTHDPEIFRAGLLGLKALFERPGASLVRLMKKYLRYRAFLVDLVITGCLIEQKIEGVTLSGLQDLVKTAAEWDARSATQIHTAAAWRRPSTALGDHFLAPGLLDTYLHATYPHLAGRDAFPTRWELQVAKHLLRRGDLISFQILPQRWEFRSTDGVMVDSTGLVTWEAKSVTLHDQSNLRDRFWEIMRKAAREAGRQSRSTLAGLKKGRLEIHLALRAGDDYSPAWVPDDLPKAVSDAHAEMRQDIPLTVFLTLFDLAGEEVRGGWKVGDSGPQ